MAQQHLHLLRRDRYSPDLPSNPCSSRAARCKDSDIRANLETSGTFAWDTWSGTLRLLDLIYFDPKLLDAELHEQHLGAGFDQIMDNASRLVAGGYPVEFRMALIPGFTDTQANIDAVVDLLHTLGRRSIHLLRITTWGR